MPRRNRIRLLITAAVIIAVAATVSVREGSADNRQREIARLAREVFERRCFACHGANGVARKNVLVLDRDRLVATRVVVPGDRSSLLLRMVESGSMPEGGPAL